MNMSFKKLPDKLSMPAALDGFKPFKMLNIFSRDISKSWKFKFFNTVGYSHIRMQF